MWFTFGVYYLLFDNVNTLSISVFTYGESSSELLIEATYEFLGGTISDKIFKAPQGIIRVNFEGVALLGFANKYYGTFHSEAIDPCSDQSLYILILLELFYDIKF